jgi:acylphosphatase
MDEIYRLEFTITGKRIQKAGFRSTIESIAMDLEITGHAENGESLDKTGMKVYSVQVVAEGTEKGLMSFIERINGINTFHRVNQLDAGKIFSFGKAIQKREHPEFTIVRGENEVSERMDEAAYYMKHTHMDMERVGGEMEKMNRGMEKTSHGIGVMEGNTSGMKTEMRGLREDSNANFTGVKEEFRGMREETDRNFKTMEGKYHAISSNLNFFVDVVAEYAAATKPEIRDKIEEIRKHYQKA